MVHATPSSDDLTTGTCSFTAPVEEAREVLEYIASPSQSSPGARITGGRRCQTSLARTTSARRSGATRAHRGPQASVGQRDRTPHAAGWATGGERDGESLERRRRLSLVRRKRRGDHGRRWPIRLRSGRAASLSHRIADGPGQRRGRHGGDSRPAPAARAVALASHTTARCLAFAPGTAEIGIDRSKVARRP